MHPDKVQVEQMQTLLYTEGSYVIFYKRGTKYQDGHWYITKDEINEAGPQTKEGDFAFFKTRSTDSFLKFAQENDLFATVNLNEGKTGFDEDFEDWEHLARYMGITDLVTLSTKVPAKIAEKFQYYTAKERMVVSNKLRELVYEYVIEQIKAHAPEDAFK